MSYDEVLTRLIEMKSRFEIGFSSIDRQFLDELYYTLFAKNIPNRGCSDCYRDAYTLSIIKLKKDKKMPQKSLFKLKPGAVISFFGEAKAYTNANLIDTIALRFLSKDPSNQNLFAELPAHWEEMVEEYLLNCANDNGAENQKPSMVELANARIAETENEIKKLEEIVQNIKAEKALAETEAFNLKEELAGANKSLEIALKENEELRKELEVLKSSASKSGKSKKTTVKEEKPEESSEKEENKQESSDKEESIPDLEIE